MSLIISAVQGHNNTTPWVDAAPPQATFKNTTNETAYLATEGSYTELPIRPGETLQLDIAEDTRIYVTNSRLHVAYYEQEL